MLRRLQKSFKYAFRGIFFTFKTEQNFRIHLTLGTLVMVSGLYVEMKNLELVALLILILLVLCMEILNTALEKFTDLLKPRLHHYVSYIKDIMAGGVLITAIGALVGGGLLFYPYLVR
jgi:diacylglycerol kinase